MAEEDVSEVLSAQKNRFLVGGRGGLDRANEPLGGGGLGGRRH